MSRQELLPTLGTLASNSAVQSHYVKLHEQCANILSTSINGPHEAKIARSHQFVQEIELWTSVLGSRREVSLLKIAVHEYQFALLALTQGHYRHAFKGLRLVLELMLQSVRLSTNEIELREWLTNKKDTVWSTLIEKEQGVFSMRFARCFFPELESDLATHRAIAEQVYRECSECVHGNIPKHIPLPDSLEFSSTSFALWHTKADLVAQLFHFVLVMRYLSELSPADIHKLEAALLDRTGHVQNIRVAIGGVKEV